MARLPMYRQIADAIRDKIKQGVYEAGTALPTEAQLRQDFACSRVTVRQALKLLIENGELESVQGSGTYVKEQKVQYDIYQQSSFAEKWAHLNADIHSDVLTFEVIKASLSLSELLNVCENDVVYHVIRVRYLDQKPITVEETWLPTSLFPDLTYQVMQGSKYHYIEKTKGLTIDRSEQEIIPVLPPDNIAKLLQIDPSQPIIEKRNRGFLSGNEVFEYSRNYFKTTDYKFTLVAKRHKN